MTDDFLTAEEFFDALEDFRGPEIELDYTPEQDAAYDEWLMNRKAKRAKKRATDHEAESRAKTLAFYMIEDNILNERSLWD